MTLSQSVQIGESCVIGKLGRCEGGGVNDVIFAVEEADVVDWFTPIFCASGVNGLGDVARPPIAWLACE